MSGVVQLGSHFPDPLSPLNLSHPSARHIGRSVMRLVLEFKIQDLTLNSQVTCQRMRVLSKSVLTEHQYRAELLACLDVETESNLNDGAIHPSQLREANFYCCNYTNSETKEFRHSLECLG